MYCAVRLNGHSNSDSVPEGKLGHSSSDSVPEGKLGHSIGSGLV